MLDFRKAKVKALLNTGARVNIDNEDAITLAQECGYGDYTKLIKLLFAAGERLDRTKVCVPDDLKPPKQVNLMHLCRESFKEHLLQMSKVNLLFQVPQLGLPSQIVEYLFYGESPSADDGELTFIKLM